MAIERRLRALVALIAGVAVLVVAVAGAAAQDGSEPGAGVGSGTRSEPMDSLEVGDDPHVQSIEDRGAIDAADFESVPVGDVIHVKFTDHAGVGGTGAALASGQMDETVADLFDSPGVTVEPLFDDNMDTTEDSKLESWVRVTVADSSRAEGVRDQLNESSAIEAALFEPQVAPASVVVQLSPDFEPNQIYRDPAPAGIDADFAAGVAGGTGAGVVVTDVEYSWNTGHEDLLDSSPVRLANGTPQDPFANTDHGTAVLGVVTGDVNGFGVTGVAPDASIQLVNTFTTSGQNLTNALAVAVTNSGPGDVIVIEQQLCPSPIVAGLCGPGWLPIEWFPSYYDVIVAAVEQGIHVVQAAGNGNRDLDSQLVFPDSGSILVGAGNAPGCVAFGPEPVNGRLDFSNYGERVDLQSHGACVWTTGSEGGGTDPDDDKSYTGDFTGTSSASAVVAGAVAAMAGVATANGDRLAPHEMRVLLRDTGSPQNTTVDGRPIGPQPNLRAAISSYLANPHPGPANDGLDSAFPLTVPSRFGQETSGASIEVGEPLPTCGFPDETVWYELAPTQSASVTVSVSSALGSPSVALWRATDSASLTEMTCTARGAGAGTSGLSARLTAGQRYLLQVGDGRDGPIETVIGLKPDCDLDANGFGDVLVGVPGESIRGRVGAGAMNVLYGSASRTRSSAPLISQAGPVVAGVAQRGDEFGFAVVCADFNGDGFDDAAVGVPGEDRNGVTDIGQVHVFWGSSAGISGRRERVLTQSSPGIPGRPERGDRFGAALAAGDVNGDGFAD
ncbi:MAG: S8 family serine peptidase, partial [Acidimicrobiales bacterium]